MIYNISAFLVFILLAYVSASHALGLWLCILLIHGMLVMFFGEAAVHFPLYCGLAITAMVLIKNQWHGVPTSCLSVTLAFIILLIITSFFGLNLSHSTLATSNYIKGGLLALLLAGCLNNESDIKVITLYCLLGLSLGSFFSIYQYLTDQYVVQNIYIKRAAGLRSDPNDTAMLLVTGVPLGLYWMLKNNKKIMKFAFLIIILLVLFSIMLTGSRGGLVTLLLVGLGFYFRRPSIKATLLAIFLSVFMISLAPDTFIDRISTLMSGQEKHGGKSMDNRKELQETGINLFLDNPVIGVGPGNFGIAFLKEKKLLNKSTDEDFSHNYGVAHNMHLEIFVETGLFGGMLFEIIMLMAMSGFRLFDKVHRKSKDLFNLGFMLSLAFSGILFAGFFLSQGKNSVLWFMVGIGFAMKKVIKINTLNTTSELNNV
jgi:O-antigen ligase